MITELIVIGIVTFFIVKFFRSFKKYDLDKIPGPPGYPIIGNLFDLLADRVTIFNRAREWSNTYGGRHKLSLFSLVHSIEISNPSDIEAVISTSTHNSKSFVYKFMQPWLQDGLLLSKGSKWHERRRILTPTFHFNILRHFTTILEENSQQLVKMLVAEVEKPETNIIPIISEYTLNSVCETAMGTKIEDESTGLGIKYKEAIYEMGTLVIERLTRAWLHFDIFFQMSPLGRDQKKMLKIIREFPSKVIRERKLYREKHGNEFYLEGSHDNNNIYMKSNNRMAMLDLLLTAEKENKIDAVGIQEEVDTFMFEGHDTTAVALNFALMELANDKKIQDKVVEEIDGIFGDSDRVATMDDLNRMKYLECCIKETLRLYPSVHFIGRQLEENITLDNLVIPSGTTCSIHIFDLHRRSDLFPNPTEFDPDRFLPENCIGRHPYAYIPFSAGPRNCIGQKFAMLEMKSAIAAILRQLQLQPITKRSEIEFSGDIVLRTTHPINISFVKRK